MPLPTTLPALLPGGSIPSPTPIVVPVYEPPLHTITYYFFDLMTGDLLATLPLNSVNFGLRMNTPGNFTGTINLADPAVRALNPKAATITGRSLLVIDMDGVAVFGGIVWTRDFTHSSRIANVSGNETWSYWAHRIQAADYTMPPGGGAFWNANPAPSEMIAAQLISDAAANGAGAFQPGTCTVVVDEAFPNIDPIVASYPFSQLQTIDSLVTNLQSGGFETGFDFYQQVNWSGAPGSAPAFTILLSYPRAGRSDSGLVISIGEDDTDYTWPEDSTTQAWTIWATAGPGGTLSDVPTDSTPWLAGWPLLESTQSYTEVNTQDALAAAAGSDLANQEWPITVPKITLPMFPTNGSNPSIFDIGLGDNCRVIIQQDEWFEIGFDGIMRITGIDGSVSDDGLSTMTLTLNLPPGIAPVPAPPGL